MSSQAFDLERDIEIAKKSELLRQIQARNDRRQNFQGAIVGETGSGKSLGAVQIAVQYSRRRDLPFSVKNIVFTADEFMDRIEEVPEFSFIVFDEAGIEYDAQNWQDDLVKILNYTIQSFRYMIINVIFTVPNKQMLAKVGRNLLHAQGVVFASRRIKWYRIRFNHLVDRHYYKKLGYTTIRDLDPELLNEYETRKADYLKGLRMKYREDLKIRESEREKKIQSAKSDKDMIAVILEDADHFKKKESGEWDVSTITVDLTIGQQRAYRLINYLREHYSSVHPDA